MSSCCIHAGAAERFFSRFAKHYRKRYLKSGLEASQRQLLAGLEQVGFEKASVLEIGCGVGYLHQRLLELGAASATGIDISHEMVVEAQHLAEQRGVESRVNYRQGDFLECCDQLESAELVVLDKVICCYPDAENLVQRSLEKSDRIYALTIPRDRWFVRLGLNAMGLLLWLFRSDFRSYLHDPVLIEEWITRQGYVKSYQNQTLCWLSQVYRRQ